VRSFAGLALTLRRKSGVRQADAAIPFRQNQLEVPGLVAGSADLVAGEGAII